MIHSFRLALASCLLSATVAAQGADHCVDAQPIAGFGPHAFDTTTASQTPGLPGCDGFGDLAVWFEWTAAVDAIAFIEADPLMSYGVRVTVFRGGDCGSLQRIGCGVLGGSSSFYIPAISPVDAGQRYFVRISSRISGSSGTGTFTITESVPVLNPANGSQYAVIPAFSGWSSARDRASLIPWQGRGGRLASLTTSAELAWVMQNLSISNVWTGAFQDTLSPSFSEPDGGWTWLDGAPASLPWIQGDPDNVGPLGQTQNYAQMDSAGLFADVESSYVTDGYLVEWTPGFGTNYCVANPNSTGAAGSMSLDGSAVIFDSDLTLVASNLPVGSFGFFLISPEQGFIANPGGSAGNLCVVGQIGRYVLPGQIKLVPASGSISLMINPYFVPSPGGPQVNEPGDTYHFQAWHRDAVGGAATSNFTDAISIMFL